MSTSLTVYKASAGSGKTFTLAVQYICLLLTTQPDEYKRTLAVTFTNKATGEMKERILEQLYGLASNLPSSKKYLKAIQQYLSSIDYELSDEQIRLRAKDALTRILHDYNHFRVETIDSFFQSVLRNLAHELNLTARLQVDLGTKEVMQQAVDNLLDGLQASDTDILAWLKDYVREQMNEGRDWDVRKNIKDFAGCISNDEYQSRDIEIRQRVSDPTLIRQFRQQMEQLRDDARPHLDAALDVLEKSYPIDTTAFNKTTIGSLLTFVRNAKKEPEKASLAGNLLKSVDEPAILLLSDFKTDATAVAHATHVSNALQQFLQDFTPYQRVYCTALLALKNLNPLRLLTRIDQEMHRITQERNTFLLSNTPILLNKLIRENDAPFVFEKMGNTFNNVMIDEFQDTSTLQWNNFRVLLLNNLAQGGQDLLVGDIKQSIYRWRNGDWHILGDIEQTMKHHNPRVMPLNTNYRSMQNVIQFNNAFFHHAAIVLDGKAEGDEEKMIQTIYQDVSQQWADSHANGGHVRLWMGGKKATDQERLEDLCQQIEQLLQMGVPAHKMAILVRNNKHAFPIISYLSNRLPDVSIVSSEAYLLRNSVALRILMECLRHLAHGHENPIPLRYVMLQYMKEIKHLTPEEIGNFATLMPEAVLPDGFIQHCHELRNMPLYELCELLCRTMHLYDIPDQSSYLFAFFDQLTNYLHSHSGSLGDFIRAWDEGLGNASIPCSAKDGIELLTIHKSKGLQYHTVFMPNLEWSIETDKGSTEWFEPSNEPYNMLGLLPMEYNTIMNNSLLHDIYQEEHRQRRIDELNTLYVAFTRAESNLMIWTCGADSSSLTARGIIAHTVERLAKYEPDLPDFPKGKIKKDETRILTLGTPMAYTAEESKKSDNRLTPDFDPISVPTQSYEANLNFRQSNEAEKYLQETDTEEASNEQEAGTLSYLDQGILLHDLFAHIHTEDDAPDAIEDILVQGILPSKEVEKIKKIVAYGLKTSKPYDWFSGRYDLFNECEILEPDGDSFVLHRPDRVMMNEEEIIVVDFKFGKPDTEYEDQVRRYMRLLGQMHPERQIHGYLWYVYRGRIQEVLPL